MWFGSSPSCEKELPRRSRVFTSCGFCFLPAAQSSGLLPPSCFFFAFGLLPFFLFRLFLFFLVSFVFVCFGALSVFPPLSALLPSPAAWCLVEAWWSSLPTWSLRVSQCGILPPCRLIELVRSLLLVCPLSRRAWSIFCGIRCEVWSMVPVSSCMAPKALALSGNLPLHHVECPVPPPHDSAEMVCAWYAPV